jgi:amino acid adenylation domain-containing protein
MKRNILEILEETAERFPNKIIYEDINRKSTYQEFINTTKKIGTSLSEKLNKINTPVAIYVDRSVACLEAMMGVTYSGNYFIVLDTKSPKERNDLILGALPNPTLIVEQKNKEKIKDLDFDGEIFIYEELVNSQINQEKLDEIRNQIIDTDPMYMQFTSGSTGVPKGIVLCHRSVITYAYNIKTTFKIDENTIFGNEPPFYFSMSTLEIYTTMLSGATMYIIPKMYFSFPIKLLEFLKEKKINTIYWVPSVLCIIANMKALDEIELPDLKKVMFAGEVMPVKQLNVWIKHLPNAMFANLYGPTEITDICTYYVVDRKFDDSESLPIGKQCYNCDVLIIKDDGTKAKPGEEGELCVIGSFLALGYYNNPEKTNSAFVQNPLNNAYPEIIYKTGDIVKENEKGEIMYLSRKDFQIKHMGYRIELGEIENTINNIEGIISCACVYDMRNKKIVLFYQAKNELSEDSVISEANSKLISYMRPNEFRRLERMLYNANGKIDRKELKNLLK